MEYKLILAVIVICLAGLIVYYVDAGPIPRFFKWLAFGVIGAGTVIWLLHEFGVRL